MIKFSLIQWWFWAVWMNCKVLLAPWQSAYYMRIKLVAASLPLFGVCDPPHTLDWEYSNLAVIKHIIFCRFHIHIVAAWKANKMKVIKWAFAAVEVFHKAPRRKVWLVSALCATSSLCCQTQVLNLSRYIARRCSRSEKCRENVCHNPTGCLFIVRPNYGP